MDSRALYHDLTAFQRDILTVLAGRQKAPGVEIMEHVDDYYESQIEPSRFYQALNRMHDKGLISISTIDGRTNGYTLTKQGKQALTAGRQFKQTYAHQETAGAIADGGTTGGDD